jgi:hypothetical protein
MASGRQSGEDGGAINGAGSPRLARNTASLNLIEPWWKVLRAPSTGGAARRGRRCGVPSQPLRRNGVLERAPASVRLGPSAGAPARPSARRCRRPGRGVNLPDAPVSAGHPGLMAQLVSTAVTPHMSDPPRHIAWKLACLR